MVMEGIALVFEDKNNKKSLKTFGKEGFFKNKLIF